MQALRLAVPVRGLELAFNGSYTDAKFLKYKLPSGEDLSSLPLLFTPKWQIGASIQHVSVFNWGKWRNYVDYSYTGRQLNAEKFAFSEAHHIVNARTSAEITRYDITVALFGRNLTNRRYAVYINDIIDLGFITNSFFNAPRTFGVEVKKEF